MPRLISSGSPLEFELGYSRAVVSNGFVFVSGCTAQGPDGQIMHPGDTDGQARFALGKIARALTQAGTQLERLVSTRVFLTQEADWEGVARAHGALLGAIRPACSMIQVVRLLKPGLLVEIEAVAALDGSG